MRIAYPYSIMRNCNPISRFDNNYSKFQCIVNSRQFLCTRPSCQYNQHIVDPRQSYVQLVLLTKNHQKHKNKNNNPLASSLSLSNYKSQHLTALPRILLLLLESYSFYSILTPLTPLTLYLEFTPISITRFLPLYLLPRELAPNC